MGRLYLWLVNTQLSLKKLTFKMRIFTVDNVEGEGRGGWELCELLYLLLFFVVGVVVWFWGHKRVYT